MLWGLGAAMLRGRFVGCSPPLCQRSLWHLASLLRGCRPQGPVKQQDDRSRLGERGTGKSLNKSF